jgi:hypothetical protein
VLSPAAAGVSLQLDLIHTVECPPAPGARLGGHSIRLQDQLLWDASNPHSCPFTFATAYVADLGLPGEFAPKVAWTIREQLQSHVGKPPGEKSRLTVPHSPCLLRHPTEAVEFSPIVRGLTVRHHIAVMQRPPPPYIAHYTPATHRHGLYVGQVIDARHVVATPTTNRSSHTPPASTHSASASRGSPASAARASTAIVYTFARCTEDTLHLHKHRVTRPAAHTHSHATSSARAPPPPPAAAASNASLKRRRSADDAPPAIATSRPTSPALDEYDDTTPMDTGIVEEDEEEGEGDETSTEG